LRAVAMMAVVGYHYTHYGRPFRGGWLGVSLFFILSGFLITRLLVEEHNETHRISLRDFYRRRVARLLPAFALFSLVLLIVAALRWDLFGAPHIVRDGFLAASTYTANTFFLRRGVDWLGPFSPTWSLSIEEQFYLLWPLILLLLLRRHDSRRVGRFVLVAAAVVFAEVIIRSVLWPRDLGPVIGTEGEPLAFLLLGCTVALLCPLGATLDASPVGRLARRYWAAAVLLLVTFVTLVEDGPRAFGPGRLLMLIVAACMVLVVIAALSDTPIRRALRVRPLVVLGQMSYGIYLWHIALFAATAGAMRHLHLSANPVARATVSLALTLVVATVSYRWVERPLRTRIRHYRKSNATLIAPLSS
jgi:peptidoglycan/LPS O-acetylase OafA/YrhL